MQGRKVGILYWAKQGGKSTAYGTIDIAGVPIRIVIMNNQYAKKEGDPPLVIWSYGIDKRHIQGIMDDIAEYKAKSGGAQGQGPPSQGPPSQGPPAAGPPAQGPPAQGGAYPPAWSGESGSGGSGDPGEGWG